MAFRNSSPRSLHHPPEARASKFSVRTESSSSHLPSVCSLPSQILIVSSLSLSLVWLLPWWNVQTKSETSVGVCVVYVWYLCQKCVMLIVLFVIAQSVALFGGTITAPKLEWAWEVSRWMCNWKVVCQFCYYLAEFKCHRSTLILLQCRYFMAGLPYHQSLCHITIFYKHLS